MGIILLFKMQVTRHLMKAAQKATTGIFGLAVHPDPRPHLIKTYNKTLNALTHIPPTATYRQATEAITQNRLKIVESTKNIQEIEEKIGAGQIEEVIWQAEDELKLVAKMEEWKPWESLEVEPPKGQWVYEETDK
ncbi:ETC complex I subunit conserved region-domain-containing protein [Glomus cerebriforme]|uniref:ETC complex I subunit conserved region-domain-containing protein n=1 Tax=Glomus cerebriforme TaxID=658196 RepID=A0A397T8D3_9GLOM|nr:ETC complex I subunit conserved region-domain-containing protein [Glomus cerebriforme]